MPEDFDDRAEHIKCIAVGHMLIPGYTWCGRRIHEFTFTSIDHAVGCLIKEAWHQPCEECMAAVLKAIKGELKFEDLRGPARETGFLPVAKEVFPTGPLAEQVELLRQEVGGLREINDILARQHYHLIDEEELEMFRKYTPEMHELVVKLRAEKAAKDKA